MGDTERLPFFKELKSRQKIVNIFFCLLVATIFWVFNALNNDYSTVISYPIRFEYDKSKIVLMQQPQRNVEVAVTGYGWQLLFHSLGFDNDPVTVKPENLVYDHYITSTSLFSIMRHRLNNIKVNNVLKDTLHFYYEDRVSKKIFLKLDKNRLNLPKNAGIAGKVRVEPSYITCTGPESEIISIPDTISFGLPNVYIEKSYDDYADINYKPSPHISQDINKVKVSFTIK